MVGIAVIGAGYWGRNHVRVFNEMLNNERIDTLKVCDSRNAILDDVKDSYRLDVVSDYHELLSDDSIDAVDIVTPSPTHFSISKDFIEAGKDVHVEKPMCLSAADARELVSIVEKEGRTLMVGHIFRHHSAVKELKKRLDSNEFGEIYYLKSNRMAFSPPRSDMGVLLALAIHEVDLFCYLLGHEFPETITAVTRCYLQPEIEETAEVILGFPGKTVGYAFESWMSPGVGKVRELLVVGSNASARDYFKPQELQMINASIKKTNGEKRFTLHDEGIFTQPIEFKEPLGEELGHFVECVKNKTRPLSDMYSGLRAVEMIEKVMVSAKEGRTVRWGED